MAGSSGRGRERIGRPATGVGKSGMDFERILTRYKDILNYTGTIDEYIAHGGYQALPKALREFQPD